MLYSFIVMYGDKSSSDCLELLISRLQDIQSSLLVEYKSDEILKDKLLNDIKYIDAFRLAYYKAVQTLQGLISDVHASLAAMTPCVPSHLHAPNAHFLDRKYKGNQNNRTPRTVLCLETTRVLLN